MALRLMVMRSQFCLGGAGPPCCCAASGSPAAICMQPALARCSAKAHVLHHPWPAEAVDQLGPSKAPTPPCVGRTLSLDGCRQLPFIDAGLEALKGLARVAVLNLQGCLTLTDLGLAAIAQMRSLACLNLQDCSSISGAPGPRAPARSACLLQRRPCTCPVLC